jgi:iron(II)-dependent oxidoreductase
VIRAGPLAVLFLPLLAVAPAAADGIMLVPAGAFWMGRDGAAPSEGPVHRVYVTDYWIERHKVTNAEFAAFLDAEGPVSPAGERRYDRDDADARIHRVDDRWVADAGFETHPAVEVSWFGARDYCAWKGRRLPTEAEWEKAGRGDDRRPYPWGWERPTPERAVLGRPYNGTAPTVDRTPGASPHGVHDLLGNLREWTATALRPYPHGRDDQGDPFGAAVSARPDDGRQAPPARRADAQVRVVVRGASHDDSPDTASITTRHSYDRRGAAAGHHHVGFRCATSEDLGGY